MDMSKHEELIKVLETIVNRLKTLEALRKELEEVPKDSDVNKLQNAWKTYDRAHQHIADALRLLVLEMDMQ